MLQFGPFADMPQYFGENTIYGVETLYVPQIGYTFIFEDKSYEILRVTTYQEKVGQDVKVAHVLKCLEIDENGEDAGSEPIILKLWDNSDRYGIVGF